MDVRRSRLGWVITAVLCLISANCGKDNPTHPGGGGGGDDLPGSVTILPAGGVYVLRESTVEIEVPANLFPADTTIRFGELPDDPDHPGYFNGTGVDFGEQGITLPGPVLLRIRFALDDLPAGMARQSIDICRRIDGRWRQEGASGRLEGDVAIMELRTQVLSRLALLATLRESEVCGGSPNQLVTTMEQLEAFRGCRAIPAGVKIQGPAITSLEALSSVELIGDLELNDLTQLTSLEGLQRLRRTRTLTMMNCPGEFDFTDLDSLAVCSSLALYGCDGVTGLTSAAAIEDLHALTIERCQQLRTIALPNLRRIGRLSLHACALLESASFGSATTVYESFGAGANPRLTTVSGAVFAESIASDLSIEECPLLVALPDGSDLATIGGNLLIEHADALGDLAFLSGLRRVDGDLTVARNPALVTLAGLEGLASVGQDIVLGGNSRLASLAHLHNLSDVGGSLVVQDCPVLTSLAGLGSIQVGRHLTIEGNDALTSVGGLAGSVDGSFEVTLNPRLVDFAGLGLSRAGSLFITGNPSLESLSGLGGLHGYHDLVIAHNGRLKDLDGLATLAGLVLVEIGYNDSITDLTGLESLTECTTLLIDNNVKLSKLTGLDNLTRVDGTLTIVGNAFLQRLEGLEGLTSVGSLRIQGNQLLQDLEGLSNLTRLGWTQPGGGSLFIIGQIHVPDMIPLCGLEPDPGTGYVIRGDLLLRGNLAMEDAGGWAFVDSIGGEEMVGGEITIENW